MNTIPTEIQNKIYYYNIDICNIKFSKHKLFKELKEKPIWLNMSEHIFPYEIEYIFANRIPRLVSSPEFNIDLIYENLYQEIIS